MTSTVWLVPHTHWDREWYEPFQRFRLRLVDLMDDVVERAAREPDFRFTMDGQMAAIDDYLEAEMALARELVTLGRAARNDARIGVRQPLPRASALLSRDEGLRSEVIEEIGSGRTVTGRN